jgi:hypothetical protein
VHLTGESQGTIRVGACKTVPAACKEFYLAERELEAAKSTEKEAARTTLYKKAAQLSKTETAVLWVMLSDATNSLQDIRPSAATGSWTAQLRHIVK